MCQLCFISFIVRVLPSQSFVVSSCFSTGVLPPLPAQCIPALARRINDSEVTLSDSRQLVAALHAAGVNCRYLGLLRSAVTAPWPRECILLEMLARTLKT